MTKSTTKHLSQRIVLRLPDLDHPKGSVLNSLSSPRSRRNYKFAMEQFITWYCSESRLALNRTVVLRFRLYLESLGLAAGTINQRLAAVRRLAYEAADSGLLSPELAAGIRRVKGVKPWAVGRVTGSTSSRLASYLRNRTRGLAQHPRLGDDFDPAWLWSTPSRAVEPAKRRHSGSTRTLGYRGPCRQGYSCPDSSDADLGEGCCGQMADGCIGHDRTSVQGGESARNILGNRHHGNVIWYVVRSCAQRLELDHLAPHDFRRTCAKLCHVNGGELEQIQFLLGHASVLTTERYLGCKQNLEEPVNDRFGCLFSGGVES